MLKILYIFNMICVSCTCIEHETLAGQGFKKSIIDEIVVLPN
jgi:hypothetical protein